MTRDDVIRWAREVGLPVSETYGPMVGACPVGDVLERFAAKVAAAEREACAQVADATFRGKPGQSVNLAVAAAIRARSNHD